MNTTTERLIEIESEREQTVSDPSFQQWMKDLGVSIAYRNPEPRLRAKDMNAQYDFQRFFSRSKLGSYLEILIK
jgi:hypothetical protein